MNRKSSVSKIEYLEEDSKVPVTHVPLNPCPHCDYVCMCWTRRTRHLFWCVHDSRGEKMEHDETGCRPHPEGPILCINNCGFFGSAATMNLCSKCHKDLTLKQEQAKLATSSINNIVNGSGGFSVGVQVDSLEPKTVSLPPTPASGSEETSEPKPKEGPNRCTTCKKRVGLTGFKCHCGDLFCGSHRYSDKHDCPFDYRTTAQDAIAKANPVVKAEKLDKI